jgi:CRP-like cAMP-binding protein
MDATQLKRIPLFSDASDEELKQVAVFAQSKEVSEGEVIVGDVFGEAGMLDDSMRSATVTATSRMRLISLGHFEVKRLKKDAPGVYRSIEELVEERSS